MSLDFQGDIKELSQVRVPETEPEPLESFLVANAGAISLMKGELKSPNYVPEQKGWKIDSEGNADFQNITASLSSVIKRFIAGETIAKGDAIKIVLPTATATVSTDSGTGSEFDGNSGGSGSPFQAVAVKYVPGTTRKFNRVATRYKKTNSPTDNLTIEIRQTTADGTLIATSNTLLGSTLTTSFADYTMTFPSIFTLTASTTYYIVFKRSGSDTVNYYSVDCGATSGGAGDSFGNQNGGAWTYANNPRPYSILQFNDGTSGTVKKAMALSANETELFIGFANEAAATGDSIGVIVSGEVAGLTLTGPAAGNVQYYLSDTAGQISTTPGTTTRKVGIALTSSSLLISNIW